MFTDSHCHLSFPELKKDLPDILAAMQAAQVTRALCVCTTIEEFDEVNGLAQSQKNLWSTVGVHPDNEGIYEPSVQDLITRSQKPKVVAIGETGLDYFDMAGRKGGREIADMQWQRDRFRVHIRAARQTDLPLVIHTRASSEDTLAILREEGGFNSAVTETKPATGVLHCFTESLQVAKAALDLGFYISFSGIITFKAAADLREVASYVPLDRCLIETDSPYLAPTPHRGKTNTPAYVPFVAQQIAQIKGLNIEEVAQATRVNFDRLFPKVLIN